MSAAPEAATAEPVTATPTPAPMMSPAPVTPRCQGCGVASFGDLRLGRLALRTGRSRVGGLVERFSLCSAGRDKLRRCDEQRAEAETGQGVSAREHRLFVAAENAGQELLTPLHGGFSS